MVTVFTLHVLLVMCLTGYAQKNQYDGLPNELEIYHSLIDNELPGNYLVDKNEFYSLRGGTGMDTVYYYDWDTTAAQWDIVRRFLINTNSDHLSTESEDANWNGSSWVNSGKTEYQYDGNDSLIYIIQYKWVGSNWELTFRSVFGYDANGNDTLYLHQEWDGSNWLNKLKIGSTYNTDNWMVYSYQAFWSSGNWLNQNNSVFLYLLDGRISSKINSIWNAGNWVNDKYHLYNYDSLDILSTEYVYTWSGTLWDKFILYTYTYDSNELLLELINQTWNGAAWDNNFKQLNIYDVNGNKLEYESYTWQSPSWKAYDKYTYAYNQDDLRTNLIYYFGINFVFTKFTQYDYTYDSKMRQVKYIRTNWKNNTWENASKREAIYHDNTSVINQHFESGKLFVKLFPNPTDLSVTVEFKDHKKGVAYADKKTLEIYSINGQKVFEKEFTGFNTLVNTSQIPPGSYIFKVYTSKLNIPIKVVIN